MKTSELSSHFKSLKYGIRTAVKKVSFSKMVVDSISPHIPKGWRVKSDSYGDIEIVPEIENDPSITADVFDKVISKFAKILHKQPNMYITETFLEGDFVLYRKREFFEYGTDYDFNIRIEIKTSNTEKCEIVYKRKMHKVAELTGYCKALSEKQYIEAKRW